MNQLTTMISSEIKTMTSEDLFKLVNEARSLHSEPEIRYTDFANRMTDELDGDEIFNYENFVVKKLHNGTARAVYTLTIEQCMLVAMRESKAVRRSVLHKLKELEAKQSEPKAPSLEEKVNATLAVMQFCVNNLNLPKSGKLKIAGDVLKSYGLETKALPSYGIDI